MLRSVVIAEPSLITIVPVTVCETDDVVVVAPMDWSLAVEVKGAMAESPLLTALPTTD